MRKYWGKTTGGIPTAINQPIKWMVAALPFLFARSVVGGWIMTMTKKTGLVGWCWMHFLRTTVFQFHDTSCLLTDLYWPKKDTSDFQVTFACFKTNIRNMFSICIDLLIVWVWYAIRKHMDYLTFNVVIFKTLKLHVRLMRCTEQNLTLNFHIIHLAVS